MKSFLFIIFSILILSGCVQKQYAKIDTPTDNSTVVIEDHSWESDQKNYWITIYFARMSYDPSVRMKYPPENLYNLCMCIIDIMENDYDYESFIRDFNKNPIDPKYAQIVYNVSWKCSIEEQQLMKLKYDQGEVDVKDAI